MHLLLLQPTRALLKPLLPSSPSSNSKPRSPRFSSICLQTQNPLLSANQPSLRPTCSRSLLHFNLQRDWLRLLQSSIEAGYVGLGLSIHAFLLKSATVVNVFLCNNLIHMYSKFCMLDAAQLVFDNMPDRNVVSWTSLISGYSSANDFVNVLRISRKMHDYGEKFNEYTYSCILLSVKEQVAGEQIHALAAKVGVDTNVFVGTSLLSMYARNGAIEEMELVFADLVDVDIRCLNSLILEYKKNQNWVKAFLTFRHVLETGLHPNEYTFTNTFSACDECAIMIEGRQVHCLAIKFCALCAVSVGNAVILMYGKHGLVKDAEKAFGLISDLNLVSWTTILQIRAKNGYKEGTIDGFVKMLDLGVPFDSNCLSTVLDACSQYRDFKFVSVIHAFACKLGYASDVFVATAILDAYAKSGRANESRLVFYCLPNPNIESFNAILETSETTEIDDEIMVMFNDLRSVGLKPDAITCSRLLHLSANQSMYIHGKALHAHGIKSGLDKTISVSNALISMYGKCGCIGDACSKFNEMIERDNVTWNAIISANAINGRGTEAFLVFESMIKERMQPDERTMVSILQACSYSGLLEDGIAMYKSMQEIYGIKPAVEHHVCFVDLLGRQGDLERAMKFIEQSEFRDEPQLWRSMVNACRICGDLKFGKVASKRLIDLAPEDSASYIIVANLCSESGMLGEAANMRVMMRDRELRKEVGCSWILLGKQVHCFIAGGLDHLQIREILDRLADLNHHLKEFKLEKKRLVGPLI